MATFVPRATDVRGNWYVLDADNQVLGRLATRAAMLLMGKHKPDYTPFLKTGDHVIIINAEKVRLTGNKEDQKVYHRHSGYPGGITRVTARELRSKFPERLLEQAITGMLPKSKLGKQIGQRLRVYVGPAHPHQGQRPETVQL
jgi:large subunit ribosomal protein L13